MIASKMNLKSLFYNYKWYSFFSVNEKRNKQKIDLSAKSSVENESNSTTIGMNHEEFRRYGKEMIDYIADYLMNIG
jgi:hypothetical protein